MPSTSPKHLYTRRLTLRRLSTPANPQDLHLFHENWSSRVATMWSMRGPTVTLDESRAWMHELLAGGLEFWAVFLRSESDSSSDDASAAPAGTAADDEAEEEECGVHVGSVSLRLPREGLMKLPPAAQGGLPVEGKSLGYALLAGYWGRGIATEAGRAVVEAFGARVRAEGRQGYIEACVDKGNPASGHVLGKIGFEQVGWQTHDPVWINGAWREGCWVYGLYV
jgi:RimJ/RimL family protein N-acetyltransferase